MKHIPFNYIAFVLFVVLVLVLYKKDMANEYTRGYNDGKELIHGSTGEANP